MTLTLTDEQMKEIRDTLIVADLLNPADVGFGVDYIFGEDVIASIVYHPTHGIIKKLGDAWPNFTQGLYKSLEEKGHHDPGAVFVNALVNPEKMLIEIAKIAGWTP